MRYTVLWKPAAERQLAELWLDAAVRHAVTQAAQEIDERLGTDPSHEGESREQGRRVLIVQPLAAFYRVVEDDRKVLVLHLRHIPAR